jgi:tetratricopeptide (TPR) repeat protein
MFNPTRIVIAIILFSLLIGFRFYLDKPYIKIINPGSESMYNHSVNMAAIIFGETRKTMAAVLWGRVLIYHTETSHATFYGPRKDVKPSDNLFKSEGEQILPILRLITWLDNHFIKAYDFGGYFLAITLNQPEEGIDFLEEGIKNNPTSYDLYQGLAYVYFHKVKNYNLAINYAKKALYNITHYPDKENPDTNMNCVNSLRIIGHSYRRLGDRVNARIYFNMIGTVSTEFEPLRDRLIANLDNEVYIMITEKTLENLKGKIVEDKLQKVKNLGGDTSEELLLAKLKIFNFTEEEIKEVLKYVKR